MTVLLVCRAFAVLLIVWKEDRCFCAVESNWEIKEKPIQFGKIGRILCKTKLDGNSLNSTTRMWHGGLHYDLLVFDGLSRDDNKYTESIDGYFSTLLIKHFNETDVNVSYGCTIGFYTCKKELRLAEELFQYQPMPDMIYVSYKQESETVSIVVRVEKVYPIPFCTIKCGIFDVISKMDMQVSQNGLFYRAFLNESFNVSPFSMARDVNVSCFIGSETILVESFPIEDADKKISIASIMALVTTIVFLCVGLTVVFKQIKRKRNKKKKKHKSIEMCDPTLAQTADQTEAMLCQKTGMYTF